MRLGLVTLFFVSFGLGAMLSAKRMSPSTEEWLKEIASSKPHQKQRRRSRES